MPGESSLSERARTRLLSRRFEPLFHAEWQRALFIHYAVDPESLQREVPFEIDRFEGKAYVTLVIFMLRRLRPRIGGRFGEWLFSPIGTHGFLNVRTYVRHRGESGIYFLAEWLSNPWSVPLGPVTFGLPYRLAKLDFRHDHEKDCLQGNIAGDSDQARLRYRGQLESSRICRPCSNGSLNEFLLERYTCFTCAGCGHRFFRVWHEPWLQMPVAIEVEDQSLFAASSRAEKGASLIGASYSTGLENVWMGRPHRTHTSG